MIKCYLGFEQLLLLALTGVVLTSCEREPLVPAANYETKNVIIIVMDGPRYSETWGDSTHQFIPRMANLMAGKGMVYTRFYTNGPTYTNAGHTAMTTGFYQEINNSGAELPQYPSIFQHWLQTTENDSLVAWVISSKDKLEILSDCNMPEWKGKSSPATNCGVDGLGSGYREDSVTYCNALKILATHHPQLALIHFRDPDFSAHQNNWEKYTNSINKTDEYIYKIWTFLQNEYFYQGTTTVFVTNDHGRHLDGISNGFAGHGDGCEGCRHINLFAWGPDFKQGCLTDTPRELVDIPATIAELMHFSLPEGKGTVMDELFK